MIAAAFALLEGFTRVYLGDHYPHDFIGAALLAMPVAHLASASWAASPSRSWSACARGYCNR